MNIINNGWLPIDSAPRDGSEMVMLWDSHYRNPIIGYWNGRAGSFGWCRDTYGVRPCKGGDLHSFIDQDDITHWQPLPQPPEKSS